MFHEEDIISKHSHRDLLCKVQSHRTSIFFVFADGTFVSTGWDDGDLAEWEIRTNPKDGELEFWYRHVGDEELLSHLKWDCDRNPPNPNDDEDVRLIREILDARAHRAIAEMVGE